MTNPPSNPLAVTCLGCGYMLRGLPEEGRCPECGVSIAVSLRRHLPFVRRPADDLPLSEPTPCVRCGTIFDQRHTTHGACPGCGAPVWFSIYGNWLRASDPTWLVRVRSGVTMWLWVFLAGLVANFVLFTGGAAVGAVIGVTRRASQFNLGFFSVFASTIWAIIAGALTLVYLARITAPDPSESRIDTRRRTRALLLAAAIVNLIGGVGMAVVMLLELGPWPLAAVSVPTVAGVFCTAGLLTYLRDIARRIPDRGLIRSTTIVIWGYLASAIPMSILGLAMTPLLDLYGLSAGLTAPASAPPAVGFGATPSGPLMALSLGACAFGAVSLVFTVWQVVLLFQYRRRLETALRQVLADTQNA